jgi:hypothetical protein
MVRQMFIDEQKEWSYKKYKAPKVFYELWCIVYLPQLDAPSRTITSISGMPLKVVKALYRVRQNITLSKMSNPIHASALSVPSSY